MGMNVVLVVFVSLLGSCLAQGQLNFTTINCGDNEVRFDGNLYTFQGTDDGGPFCVAHYPESSGTSAYTFEIRMRAYNNSVMTGAKIGVAFNIQSYDTFEVLYLNLDTTTPEECYHLRYFTSGQVGGSTKGPCPGGPPKIGDWFTLKLDVLSSSKVAMAYLNDKYLDLLFTSYNALGSFGPTTINEDLATVQFQLPHFAGCSSIINAVSDPKGTFTTLNYPGITEETSTCRYTLVLTDGQSESSNKMIVRLFVEDFDLPEDDDYIEIQGKRYSKGLGNIRKSSLLTFDEANDYLTIDLSATVTGSSSARGFSIKYHVYDAALDICDETAHTVLRNNFYRSLAVPSDPSNYTSDNSLALGYYRFQSCAGGEIPTTVPDVNFCGTHFPVYMQDVNLPDPGLESTGTVCSRSDQNNCAESWEVGVHNCGSFNLYYLTPTIESNSGYCAGEERLCNHAANETSEDGSGCSPCIVGSFPSLPSKPAINTWEIRSGPEGEWFEMKCEISPPETDEKFKIQVQWHIEGQYDPVYEEELEEGETAISFLHEKHLLAGKDISCQGRAKFILDSISPWGPWEKSDPFFVGANLDQNQPLSLTSSQHTAEVSFHLTVPFLCKSGIPDDDQVIRVVFGFEFQGVPYNQYCANPLQYQPELLSSTDCFTEIKCGDWDKAHKHELHMKLTGQYGTESSKYTVKVVMEAASAKVPSMWSDYTIGSFEAHLQRELPAANEALRKCTSYNDPHITTFHGTKYDNHLDGEFYLYKSLHNANVPNPPKYQVTAKYAKCSSSSVRCNYEVAVLDGNEVWCTKMEGNFLVNTYVKDGQCNRKKMKVYAYDDATRFGVRLNNGAVVTIMRSGARLNIDIQPSDDEIAINEKYKEGSGLCGKAGKGVNTDLVDLEGNSINKNNPDDLQNFNVQWKLTEEESLLEQCTCTRPPEKIQCQAEEKFSTCLISGKRNIQQTRTAKFDECVDPRMEGDLDENNLVNQMADDDLPPCVFKQKIDSRYTGPPLQNLVEGWTVLDAEEYCKREILDSPVGQNCDNVAPSTVDVAYSNCVADVMATNSTDFTEGSITSMMESCRSEMRRNLTLVEIVDDGSNGTSVRIPPELEMCSNNCSGRGYCDSGICRCNDGFLGSDCGVDVEDPPKLWNEPENYICDVHQKSCSRAVIYGEGFVGVSSLSCHLEGEGRQVAGTLITGNEVRCLLQKVPNDEPLAVERHQISISNDGVHRSLAVPFTVFDSLCMSCSVSGDDQHCSQLDTACVIDQRCVSRAASHPSDACLFCDPDQNTDQWTIAPECRPSGDMEVWSIVLIALGCGCVVGLVAGLFVIAKKGKKVSPHPVDPQMIEMNEAETAVDADEYSNPSNTVVVQ